MNASDLCSQSATKNNEDTTSRGVSAFLAGFNMINSLILLKFYTKFKLFGREFRILLNLGNRSCENIIFLYEMELKAVLKTIS